MIDDRRIYALSITNALRKSKYLCEGEEHEDNESLVGRMSGGSNVALLFWKSGECFDVHQHFSSKVVTQCYLVDNIMG
ncbi:unnamed protein product [Schistosoma bovis]|nr:unnamed protein product [Schistosoma bovis]